MTDMPLYQQFITIGVAVLGTVLTRFLPYILFPEGKKSPGSSTTSARCWHLPSSAFSSSTACGM